MKTKVISCLPWESSRILLLSITFFSFYLRYKLIWLTSTAAGCIEWEHSRICVAYKFKWFADLISCKFRNIFERRIKVDISLTLILPELRIIRLCHHYRARPACTSLQSDQCSLTRLYTVGGQTLSFNLDFPKNDNGEIQK